jgi:hypothetical protein
MTTVIYRRMHKVDFMTLLHSGLVQLCCVCVSMYVCQPLQLRCCPYTRHVCMCVLNVYQQSTFLAAVAFPACGLLVALLKLEESKKILAIPRSLLKDIADTGVSKL